MLFLCLVAVLATGCSQYKKISLEHLAVKEFKMKGLSTAQITVAATVYNPSGSEVTLTDVAGILYMDQKSMAHFSLTEPISFPKKATTTKEGPMLVKIDNLLSLFSGPLSLDDSTLERLTMDIDATFLCAGIKHHKKFPGIPVKSLVSYE